MALWHNWFSKLKSAPPAEEPGAPGDDKLVKFLAQPLVLEESGPPRLLSQLLVAVSVLVAGSILFAAFTDITESAVVQGQLVPSGSINTVQHLEGGIVAEILVEDGQIVEPGQTLVRMDGAAAVSDLDQARAREAALALRAERLRAFVMDREPDFSIGSDYPDLVQDQEAILDLQLESKESQQKVLRSRIAQRQAELKTMREQEKALKQQVSIISEQAEMRRTLLKKGLVSRVIYLETERALSEAQGELAGVLGRMVETKAAIGEAQNSLLELNSKLRNEALSEMGEVTAELAQVRESADQLRDRAARLVVVSPARGIVKGMATRTVGAVIGPGETLMEVVPLDDVLVAEVRIAPKDIGHLRVGQSAKVKVTTFDLSRLGSIDGQLRHLSATTFEDERQEPYYKGTIELSQNYVGAIPGQNRLSPGMVVDADIVTGEKSLLDYLLRPLYRGLDGAFRER